MSSSRDHPTKRGYLLAKLAMQENNVASPSRSGSFPPPSASSLSCCDPNRGVLSSVRGGGEVEGIETRLGLMKGGEARSLESPLVLGRRASFQSFVGWEGVDLA
jgi:hypothetical protein